MKERKPRYTLCNCVTDNIELVHLSDEIRQKGYSHTDIYVAGLETLRKDEK